MSKKINVSIQLSKVSSSQNIEYTENDFQLLEIFIESAGIDPIKGHTSNE
jgi:hypothetical protein